MSLQAVSIVEPKRKSTPSVGLHAAVGAAVGAGLRYVLPTKNELNSVDKFVSSAAMNARGTNRSILKYAGIGALVASVATLFSKTHNEKKDDTNVEYTKLGTLVDACDTACAFMWFSE